MGNHIGEGHNIDLETLIEGLKDTLESVMELHLRLNHESYGHIVKSLELVLDILIVD